MPVNDATLSGWPFHNHAMETRATQQPRGPNRSTMIYPRRKFTFVVEFVINQDVYTSGRLSTDLGKYLENGKLMATLRSIDHPKPTMTVETLRSYNKKVIIPTTMEYAPSTMTFHDDNASIALALWREYRAYYQYAGTMGTASVKSSSIVLATSEEFRLGNSLTGSDEVRSGTDIRPSLGMTLKSDSGRHFFDAIKIYDLGSDPDSVNVYNYIYPVITSLDHENLDFEDRAGQVGVGMTFEYENYYHLVGINNAQFQDFTENVLNAPNGTPSPSVGGHITMFPPDYDTSFYNAASQNAAVHDFAIPPSTSFGDNPPVPLTEAQGLEAVEPPVFAPIALVPNTPDAIGVTDAVIIAPDGTVRSATQSVAVVTTPLLNKSTLVAEFSTIFDPNISMSDAQYDAAVTAISSATANIPANQLNDPNYLTSSDYTAFKASLNEQVRVATNNAIASVTILDPSVNVVN